MIVYDITSSESFGDIHLWMRGLEKFTFLQKIIVGNKADMSSARVRSFFFCVFESPTNLAN